MSIGYYLRNIRIDSDITRKELSDITGISTDTIYSIENDRRKPSYAIVQILLDAMGYKLEIVSKIQNKYN